MRFNKPCPNMESDVTRERIAHYSTTQTSCQCMANRFNRGDCKHIAAVRHGCGCPETVWLVEPNQGRRSLCAEPRCEYGAILRQALMNEGWVEIPDGILPRSLCFVCEVEIAPRVPDEVGISLRYCHGGEHWILPSCSHCVDNEAVSLNTMGAPVCEKCSEGLPLPLAV